MTGPITRIGIDCSNELLYAARVEHGSARPEIKALMRLPRTGEVKHHLLDGGELVLAVPDSKVIVRRIRVAGSDPGECARQARFEMVQSVLEDESQFIFDTTPTNQDDLLLGTIIHRRSLSANGISDFAALSGETGEPRYVMRALALGRGYLNFCREEAGELICLADLCSRIASLCFIHRGRIVGSAWISTEKIDLEKEEYLERLAVELKTVLNFQLSSLAADGITAPLAALLISGAKSTDRVLQSLGGCLSMNLKPPRINSEYFADPSQLESIPIASYLIPLGLATN